MPENLGVLEQLVKSLQMIETYAGMIAKNNTTFPMPSGVSAAKPPAEGDGVTKAKTPTRSAKKGSGTEDAAAPKADELDISLDDAPKAKVYGVQECRDALEAYKNLNGLEQAKDILREFKSAKVSVVPEDQREAFVNRCLGNT